ncbi:MAG: S9 family peptidase [Chloroflexi bacterium]|nr:S9 family peptidase [Chloroflexota bacterium]
MSDKIPFEQYAATRIYTGAIAYSPDGRHIAHVANTTGQFNLWTIPSGGGIPRQLTAYNDDTVRGIAWRPDGKVIVYNADSNGTEQHGVYVIPSTGGIPKAITTARAQHYLGATPYSPDMKTLAYSGNDVTPENMEVILRDLETGETGRPFPAGGAMFIPADWSPSGRYLTAMKLVSNTQEEIFLMDMLGGEVVNVTETQEEIVFSPGPWLPDNSGFYIITNQGREFTGLAFYRIDERRWEWVETPEHDVEQVSVSKDGRVLIWAVNEDGASRLYGRSLTTGNPLALPDLPLGVIDAIDINPDGSKVALIFTTASEAANLYEFDLRSGEMLALGQSMIGGIDPATMITPELIQYPTHDGRMIPAWLYRPAAGVSASGKLPVVLSIHGGPESQERPRYAYMGLYQYLTSRGYAVLAPNIRGSTGYGRSYQKLIHRDWGGDELGDIRHAAEWLRVQDWVDAGRLIVFGGSFGGFATLSAMTRLPEYWAFGVDIVGPSNLITFVKSVPPHWRSFTRGWVGDAEDDQEMLIERSPITYVDNIRSPLLVIQGANDPRVVQAESDQMVERIRQRGGDVTYYVDPEEGHGTTRRANALKWYKMIVEAIEEKVPQPAPAN